MAAFFVSPCTKDKGRWPNSHRFSLRCPLTSRKDHALETEESSGVVELLSKGLALLGTVCLGFSVVYDWGYLSGLGLNFREVPTSLTDHLRSAIIWLPQGIFFVALATIGGFFIARHDNALPMDKSSHEKKEKLENFLALVSATICVGSWILLGDRFLAMGAFGVGQFFMVLMFVVTKGASRKRRTVFLVTGMLFFAACGLFGLGNISASSTLQTKEMDSLLIKKGESVETIRGIVLRRFDQCVIFMNEKRILSVLKPEDLVQVTTRIESRSNKGALCKYLDRSCPISPPDVEIEKKK